MRIHLFLFTIVIVLLFSGCSSKAASISTAYQNTKMNMELQLPPQWVEATEDGRLMLYKQTTPDRRAIVFLHTTIIGKNIENLDAEAILNSKINLDRIVVTDMNKRTFTLHSAGIKTISSYKALQFYYSSQNIPPDEIPKGLENYHVLFPVSEIKTTIYVGRTGYEIDLFCHPDDFAAISKEYNTILSSFRPII